MNKESLLQQVKIVQDNVNRFATLLEVDLLFVPDDNVAMYCLLKARLQIENIEREINESKTPLLTPTP